MIRTTDLMPVVDRFGDIEAAWAAAGTGPVLISFQFTECYCVASIASPEAMFKNWQRKTKST